MHSNPPFISQYSIDQYSEWLKALDVFNDTLPSSENIKAILKSLKSIRNKIIGSPECKKLFATQDLFKKYTIRPISCKLNSFSSVRFAVIISTKMSEVGLRDCQKECAIIIGSLAFEGVPEVNKLIENILLRPLLDLFLRCAREEPDFSLLEAIARTARTIFRFQRAPKDLPFEVSLILSKRTHFNYFSRNSTWTFSTIYC